MKDHRKKQKPKKLIINSNLSTNIKRIQVSSTSLSYFLISTKEYFPFNNDNNYYIFNVLNIPSNNLSEDFQELIKFLIPSGLYISGIIFSNTTKNEVISIINTVNTIKNNQSKYFTDTFLSLSVENMEIFENKPISQVEFQLESIVIDYNDINSIINEKYLVFSMMNSSIIGHIHSDFHIKYNEIIENLEKNACLHIKDLRLTVPFCKISEKSENPTEKYCTSNDDFFKFYSEKNGIKRYFNKENQINVELYLDSSFESSQIRQNKSKLSINTINNSTINNKFKSSQVNIHYFLHKDSFSFTEKTFSYIFHYFLFIFKSIQRLNQSSSSFSYSLYSYQPTSNTNLFFYILYSYSITFQHDPYEELLYTQRRFYSDIYFTENSSFPILKQGILVGYSLSSIEIFNKEVLSSKEKTGKSEIYRHFPCLSPHFLIFNKEIIRKTFVSIRGDYLFYHHISNVKYLDNSISYSKYALLTLLSWMSLNGYLQLSLPYINLPSEVMNKKDLSIEDISLFISSRIDVEIEVLCFKSSKDLLKNIDILAKHLISFSSPIILHFNKDYYTILSITHDYSSFIGLNHQYSHMKSNLFSIIDEKACFFVNVNEFFSVDSSCKVMLTKNLIGI